MVHLWQTQPLMRTAPMQRMMMDATLYRMAKRTAATNPQRAVPPVQRPGVIAAARSGDDSEVKRLEARFHKTGSQKDMARFLEAKWRNRG